jgi:hypothetical protein
VGNDKASKPAVSRVSKPARLPLDRCAPLGERPADLEIGDTAGFGNLRYAVAVRRAFRAATLSTALDRLQTGRLRC